MRKRLLVAAVLSLLAGCGATPSSTGSAQVVSADGTVVATQDDIINVPVSVPFLTLFDWPEGSWNAPRQTSFDSQVELDQFIADYPGAIAGSFASSDPAPLRISNESEPDTVYGKVDFSRYRAVYFHGEPSDVYRGARIISIEEKPDKLVVHTARWNRDGGSGDADLSRHFVAIPRSSKPIEFAPTLVVSTGRGPSWRAVPNPELSRERVVSLVRDRLGGEPRSLSVEKRTYQWYRDYVGTTGDATGQYSVNSEVWVAIAEGQLSPSAFPGPIGVLTPTSAAFSRIVYAISIEDGRIFGSLAKPL